MFEPAACATTSNVSKQPFYPIQKKLINDSRLKGINVMDELTGKMGTFVWVKTGITEAGQHG